MPRESLEGSEQGPKLMDDRPGLALGGLGKSAPDP